MANAPSVLNGSVGFGGQNQKPDVQLVQALLNAVPAARGGPTPALEVDSLCGPITTGAIRRFQQTNHCLTDGRIDPGMSTEKALVALLEALGKLAAILGGASAAPPPPPSPVQAGPNSPVRRRFLSVVRSLLPASGLTAGTRPAIGTNCGEFPGRVFFKLPVIPPNQPGAFKVKVPGAGTLFLTSPTTWWEKLAQEVDSQHAPARKCWVPFGGSSRPLPGDIYLLSQHARPAEFQHVGVIVDSTGSVWTTGDGGQGNGGQFGFARRTFQPSGEIQGEFGNKAWLKGWVDLDNLYAVAASAFPTDM